jgi:hypothetical protein
MRAWGGLLRSQLTSARKWWPMPSSPAPRTAGLYPAFVATLPSMADKTVAITGYTSGTGLVLAQTCGDLGVRVVTVNRPSQRADPAPKALTEQGIDAVHVPCDLQSFDNVRAATVRLKDVCDGAASAECALPAERTDRSRLATVQHGAVVRSTGSHSVRVPSQPTGNLVRRTWCPDPAAPPSRRTSQDQAERVR